LPKGTNLGYSSRVSFKNNAAEYCHRWVIDGLAWGKGSSLPSRRLEVVGAKKKVRARETRVSPSRAPVRFLRLQREGVLNVRESGLRNPGILLVESGILGFGIRNTAQGPRNPFNDYIKNPSSTDKKFGIKYPDYGIQDVEPRIQDFLRFKK